jgi:tetratricopeptide (TPR) repeat protein
LKKYVAGTRGSLFNQAMQAKNTAEMIRLGNEALTEDPESLDYLYLLAFGLRANDLLAQPPSFSHAAQILDYTQRTLRLLESGKVPTIVDKTKWNANQSMSLLYQSIALVEEKNGNFDKATEAFQKAASLDGTVAFNFLKLGSLFQLKYQDAVKTFQAFPDADRIATAEEMKPEVKSALAELNRRADAVIEAWAHFMALTASKNDFGPTRDQVDKALTELYKFRHPDSEDGLQKLIEQYRTNSSPTTASSKP